jgi:hypothetical protein
MGEAGVESGQDDARHGAESTRRARGVAIAEVIPTA